MAHNKVGHCQKYFWEREDYVKCLFGNITAVSLEHHHFLCTVVSKIDSEKSMIVLSSWVFVRFGKILLLYKAS